MTRLRVLFLLPVFAAGLVVGAAMPVLSQSAGSKVTPKLARALAAPGDDACGHRAWIRQPASPSRERLP